MSTEQKKEAVSFDLEKIINDESESICKKFSLNAKDVEPILRKTLRTDSRISFTKWTKWSPEEGTSSASTPYFWPNIGDALEILPPERAMQLFNRLDPDQLAIRLDLSLLFSYMGMLYNYNELQKVTAEFINYLNLKANRLHIIRTGFPSVSFKLSPWMENNFANLYPTRWPLCFFHGNLETNDLKYTYEWLSENTDKDAPPKPIDLIENLDNKTDIRIRQRREKLMNLKIKLFGILLKMLTNRSSQDVCDNLLNECVNAIFSDLEPADNALFLQIDLDVYESMDRGSESRRLVPRLESGGILSLICLIGHYWREISHGTFNTTRDSLGSLFSPFQPYPPRLGGLFEFSKNCYYEMILRGRQREMDMALHFFQKSSHEERDILVNYFQTIGSHYEHLFKTSSGMNKQALDAIEQKFKTFSNGYLNWMVDYVEVTGKNPDKIELPDPKAKSRNRLEKVGDKWIAVFRGSKQVKIKHSLGLYYIAFLLSNLSVPIKALKLDHYFNSDEIPGSGLKHTSSKQIENNKDDEQVDDQEEEQEYNQDIQLAGTQDNNKGDVQSGHFIARQDWQSQSSGENISKNKFCPPEKTIWLKDMVDRQTILDMKKRMKGLQDVYKIEKNKKRREKIEKELQGIIEQIKETVGKRNKSRKFKEEDLLIKDNVSTAIRRALKDIKKEHPSFYSHLETALTPISYELMYRPKKAIEWDVSY